MSKISMGSAIGAGFRLIGREPSAVLVWLGGYLIYAVVMWGLVFAAAPDFFEQYVRAARNATIRPDAASTEALVSSMQGLWAVMPVMAIAGLAVIAVLLGAIYRAILQPEMRNRAYIRFGQAELWLLLTFIAWLVVSVIVYMVVVVVVALIAGIGAAGAVGGGGLGVGLILLLAAAAIAGLAVILWIVMRLSIGLPISFERSRFALFEGWTATRGQGGRPLIVGVVLLALMSLLQIVALILFGMVGGATSLIGGGPLTMAPIAVVWAVLGSAVGLGFLVILAAPSADIYRQLKGEDLSVFS